MKFDERPQLFVYDFDGVMTDNTAILNEEGIESVVINRSDGLAVRYFYNLGIQQLILTTETSAVVNHRAKKLQIPIISGSENKKEALTLYCQKNSIPLKNVLYIGNDLNDLEVMKCVGYPLCPSDAYPEIKAIAKWIIPVAGGKGVIRYLLEKFK